MAIDLRDRPIIITGASSGIGRATALACAREGMPVVAAARREERLAEVVASIERDGGRAIAVACDVTDGEANGALVRRCAEAFGPVYAVFANAGVGLSRPVQDTTQDELREIFEINFFSMMALIRPALAVMRAEGRGHVLACSSCIGKFAVANAGAYSATKGAQWLLVRALHHDLRGTGIVASSVHPIGTKTEFFQASARRSGRGAKRAPSGPFVQSSDTVARAVVRCLRRPRTEVWTSVTIRALAAVGTMFPAVVDAAVRRRAG